MIRGLFTSAAGMMVQETRQNTISNNLANVNTVGYKKDQTIIQEFPEFDLYRKDDEKEITAFENKSLLTKIGRLGTGAQVKDIATIHDQGSLRETNNTFDFAMQGDEFFAVESKGEIKLTRNGSFLLNNEGYVVTNSGDKVLGLRGGSPSYIKIEDGKFEIGKEGEIFGATVRGGVELENNININPSRVSKFFTVKVNDKENLIKEGQNYYSLRETESAESSAGKVKQGFLEDSTVNTVKEMVEMIMTSRLYETNQKALKSQDDALGKVVSEVGKWG